MGRPSRRFNSPRSFVIIFVAAAISAAALVFSVSAYVNPWGNYGDRGYFDLYNARSVKTAYLDTLEAGELPEVVVLGSSNVMRFSGASIQQHLGKSGFCYGVFWGKADDMFCIASHLVHDLDHRPDLLIVGMDTWTFKPARDEHPMFPGVRRRLLNTPALVKHHPYVSRPRLLWSKFMDGFSGQQFRHSIYNARRDDMTRGPHAPLGPDNLFAVDGTRQWYGDIYGDRGNLFEMVERGEDPVTHELRSRAEAGRYAEISPFDVYDFDTFYERRVRMMEAMLALCSREGIDVVFVINPVHPIFFDVIMSQTDHPGNLDRLRQLLARFEVDYPAVVGTIDATQVEKFEGDPTGFYDAVHPATRNCDRILQRVSELIAAR